jgi:hypothetical protein
MIGANSILALNQERPIMPGEIVKGRPKSGESLCNDSKEAYELKTTGFSYPSLLPRQ